MGLDDEQNREIADRQRECFNKTADNFDRPQPREVMARLGEIVAAARLREGETVVDVGSGVGVLIPLIESYRVGRVVACDLSEGMLRRLGRNHPSALRIQCDVVWLPIAANCANAVFLNAMFGNIANKRRAVTNIAQALRPGGRMIVSHPEGGMFVEELSRSSDLFVEPLPNRTEFEQMLKPEGFEVVEWRDEAKLYLMVARKNEAAAS